MTDLDYASGGSPFSKNRRIASMPRKAVGRERLIELIKERVQSRLPHLQRVPPPIPIPIQASDGGPNWKIDVFVGVPFSAFDSYMAIIGELMDEYDLI